MFEDKTQLMFLIRKANPVGGYEFIKLMAPYLKDHPVLIGIAQRSDRNEVYQCLKALAPYLNDKDTFIHIAKRTRGYELECIKLVISIFKDCSEEDEDTLIEYLRDAAEFYPFQCLELMIPKIENKDRLSVFASPKFCGSGKQQLKIIDRLLPLVGDKEDLLSYAYFLPNDPSLPSYLERWAELLNETTPLLRLIKRILTDEYVDILAPKLNIMKAIDCLGDDKTLITRVVDRKRRYGIHINEIMRYIISTDPERALYRVLSHRDNAR